MVVCTLVNHMRAVGAGRILEQDMDIFDKTLAVNYCGVVHTVKAAVPGMVARREGQVVIIASVMAIIGVPPSQSSCHTHASMTWASTGYPSTICKQSCCALAGFAGYGSYAPTKWAVRGFADCLRNEVCPTYVTNITARGSVTNTIIQCWFNV